MTDRERREAVVNIPEHADHSPEEEQLPYPNLAPVVCLFFKQTTTLRKWCIKVTCGPWLNCVSLLMVLLNCLTVGMHNPSDDLDIKLEVLEYVVFIYFVLEVFVNMMALGIYGYEGSFISNNWNKFDIFIICAEVLDYCLASFGFYLHISHPIKPMRLICRLPSMRDLVIVLLKTMPMFAKALLLYMFVIHIFSVMGVQLWKGELRNRCFLGEDIHKKYNVAITPYYMYGESSPFICSAANKHGMQHCSDVPPYREDGKTCTLPAPDLVSADTAPTGTSHNNCINWNLFYNICRAGDYNPQIVHFDNIWFSWITIFQVVTLEGWTEIMFYVMDADSFWNFLLFILITIMGAFIMMNVCAVVIATQFSQKMGGQRREQLDKAVDFSQLWSKFTEWIKRCHCRHNRHHNRVHPRHWGSRRNNLLKYTWMTTKNKLQTLVKSKAFDYGVMFVLSLNLLDMAIEHHDQPVWLTHVLHMSNTIFTILYAVEMVVKLLALDWRYFRDQSNIFDFVIVMISLWEMIFNTGGKLSTLRVFRMLRIVRLVLFLPFMKKQLLVLKRTIQEATPLFRLLFLVIFIFSLTGMQLFGGKFKFKTQNGEIITDRKNFDSLLWAMVTVFQILTQEDWNLVLYNGMSTTSPWAALYFVAVIIFGKQLLNVLMGIVVDSFQANRNLRSDEVDLSSENATPRLPNVTSHTQNHSSPGQDNRSSDCGRPLPLSLTADDACSQTENSLSSSNQGRSLSLTASSTSTEADSATDESNVPNTSTNRRYMNWIRDLFYWFKAHEDWSLYMLSPQNRFRVICQSVISHQLFDRVILVFILLSCITIAIERPEIDPASTEQLALDLISYICSGVFLVEMLIKVLALGLFIGKDSYCHSRWNVLDGLLVILSFDNIIIKLVTSSHVNLLNILKVLRLLRTLRPLRLIRKAPKLRLAVEALISSLKPIGNIVLISCAFLFFFGVLGVQLFKGTFYYCVGQDTRNITNKAECLSASYRWVRKDYNFDDLLQALMTLFVMYSKDGWLHIMYDGLDAVGVDQQPQMNHNQWVLIYFISFMIVSFLLLDMFIGVMVDTFRDCQRQQRTQNLAEGETAVHSQCNEVEQIPYYEQYSPIRRALHTLCTSSIMEYIVTAGIVTNVTIMAIEHYEQPEYIEKFVEFSFIVFTGLLIIEVLLKLAAFGFERFIKFRWNLIDTAVVLVSITSIILKMSYSFTFSPSILRTCRVLRMAHVVQVKNIQVLLKTVVKTLSQVGSICLLFMFFFFIYAALGVELFGKLECTNSNPCLGLNKHVNFQNFGLAVIVLFQLCTGDNWSWIMRDTLRDCHEEDHQSCFSYWKWAGPIYLISFVIKAQFVLANLIIAAIMQAMEESMESETCFLIEGNTVDSTLPPQGGGSASTSRPAPAEGCIDECHIER